MLKINNIDPVVLDQEQCELFVMMQLAYLAQCSHPDIQTAIAFLWTHVMKLDEDDYKELASVVCYLHGTWDMILIDNVQRWCVCIIYVISI